LPGSSMSGQHIFQYEVLEQLGEGGMGIVYKARDTKLHRTVALKSLRNSSSLTSTDRERLLGEARAAASLNHPNICSVIDILDHESGQYIVMEFVEGMSLKARILQKRLTTTEILDYAVQIAEGLAEAHRTGIVHRDVKPENVIITPSGRAKVMDFGLARRAGATQLTQQGTVVGTIAYMSPEQARGETVDHRTDIWSFGVLLYEVCVCALPFASNYDQAVIYGILHENPKPLRSHNPDIPEALEQICGRCLAKAPADRYQTMEECLADLRALRVPTRTGLQTSSRTSRVRKVVPQIAVSITAAVIMVVAALILFRPGSEMTLRKSSVAVLPFKNLSDKDEDAFFAEGLTEDII